MKQVVILAGGQSKRMKSKLSKVMHPLGGRRVLDYVIERAQNLSPESTVLVTSPSLSDLAFDSVQTVIQDPAQGTGDAVKYALPHLKPQGHVLVLFGDTPLITDETITRVFEEAGDAAVVVLGMRPQNPHGYGRLITDSHNNLLRIVEQKDCTPDEANVGLCNSGVMLVDGALLPAFLEKLSPKNAAGEYYLTDCVALAQGMGKTCRVVEGDAQEFLGINTRQDLALAEAVLQNRFREYHMSQGVTLVDPQSTYFSYDTRIACDVTLHPHVNCGPGVEISEDAIIYPYTCLEDSTIGRGAKVGPFARLRGHVVLGEKAEIGNFVEVKKSTFGTKAKAKHLSYVGDTKVGDRANIGAGTITCNYDGFNKSLTMIGNDVLVGSNTSLIAPVALGDGSIVGAGSVITNDTPENAITLERSDQRILKNAAVSYRKNKNKK